MATVYSGKNFGSKFIGGKRTDNKMESDAGVANSQAKLHPGLVMAALAFHLVALLAPWTFTWSGLVTATVLAFLTLSLGIGLGYHRLLCHRSFRAVSLLRYFLILLGVLAFQKGPITWCAIHRLHHRYSDQDQDPQMSNRSFLWAHLLWALASSMAGLSTPQEVRRVTKDLEREPFLHFLERYFYLLNVTFALILFLAGWCGGSISLGISLLVWGFFVRIVCTWHITFLANSVTHRWGYRNYPSGDNSRNSWWVALLTFGEGWHNNHHYQPRCASHGHKWFEVDVNFTIIRLLEWFGFADQVIRAAAKSPLKIR